MGLLQKNAKLERTKKEDFEKDLEHTARWIRRVCRSGQTRCSPSSRKPSVNFKLERESGWSRKTPTPNGAEHGRSSGHQEPSLIAVLSFASAMKALCIGASFLIEHGERNDSWSEL